MPKATCDASTQTDPILIDTTERKFKQEAMDYLEGRKTGPPSAGMLQWLGENLAPVSALPTKPKPFDDLTPKERSQLAEMRKARVAELLRRRAAGDKRALYALNPWLRP
ncbi:hypothetical protein B0H11DRAFT_2225315 [Mycena galericulata]|nr:hypothetical protein B0H11DRAFT_2230748 [Mycena galericulata]KAJ7500926.1 hypothetical protein B0H11DRAFT_2225315 [Mycena galericulata]